MSRKILNASATVIALVLLAVLPLPAPSGGTMLTVSIDPNPIIECREDGTGADVTFTCLVTSTAAANAATVTASIDGGEATSIASIASGNVTEGGGWTFTTGSTKVFEGEYTTFLANGTHTIVICATQAGSGGNPSKTACSAPLEVTIDCQATGPCANVAFFGEVVGNKNLCAANSNIEVQFQGDFGDPAYLTITGPNSFQKSLIPVNRAGDSCNYHYNWAKPQDEGATSGQYTFEAEGNGNSAQFGANLLCQVPGPPAN